MKDICVWLVVALAVFFGFQYILKIRRGAIPTTSTWIIFLVGCTLSFLTYFVAENRDIKSGILNAVDLVYVSAILLAITLWSKSKVKFEPFEKWYLVGAGGIVVYGFATGNAWNSNILTQVLMSAAYIPMFHKLFVQKKKIDSYFAWIPAAFNALVALYPASYEGNTLSVIYALRAFVFSLATALLMAYYQFRTPRT